MLSLIRERFVPVPVDQHVHRRRTDEEGKLFAKVLAQAGRGLEGRSQGVYLFAPDGKLLAFANTGQATHVKRLLHEALEKPGAVKPATSGEAPESMTPAGAAPPNRPDPAPPAGGLVVEVSSKVLGGYEDSTSRRAQLYAASLGRDHLWIREDEKKALARGDLPASLVRRILRYHLVDNTRGEPPYWTAGEIRESSWSLEKGVLKGRVRLESARGDRGYRAEARGHVGVEAGDVTRFDVVVSGTFRGRGRFTRGAPGGEFPFAVAFRIIQPSCVADRTPPGGARGNLKRYLD